MIYVLLLCTVRTECCNDVCHSGRLHCSVGFQNRVQSPSKMFVLGYVNTAHYSLYSLSLSERAIKVISTRTDRAAAILNYHLPPSQNFPAASSAGPEPVTFEGSVRTKFRQCLPPSLFLPFFRYAFSLLAREGGPNPEETVFPFFTLS